jgi:hypothetical protein
MMLLNHLFWNAFHAENLDVETSPVGERIIDRS